jgi:uncharacterized protein YdhG (YjbR/CyaY superfamily)
MENEVITFMKTLKHPLKAEIEEVRTIILNTHKDLAENIKWNGYNFHFHGGDRITMRIQPPHLQLIFNRGVKASAKSKKRLIDDVSGLLEWKTSDRAVLTVKSMEEIETNKKQMKEIILKWLAV